MKNWKKILNKILYPPIWLMIVLTVTSAVLLPLIFIKDWESTPVAYASYVMAFYAVSVLTLFFIKEFPRQYEKIKERIYSHPLGNKYMTDAAFKVRVSLFISLAINLFYSAFKLVSGIFYSSLWIGAIAVYYILLSVIRFMLLNQMHRKSNTGLEEEFRSYRMTAILMLCINLTLSGIVLNMILGDTTPAESDIVVITSAAYTFYMLTASACDLIKCRKQESPVISAAKAIRFAQALVSLLSLEASMLVQFGSDESYRKLMLALSGAGVCILVLSMSVYMIIRANKEIKKPSSGEEDK